MSSLFGFRFYANDLGFGKNFSQGNERRVAKTTLKNNLRNDLFCEEFPSINKFAFELRLSLFALRSFLVAIIRSKSKISGLEKKFHEASKYFSEFLQCFTSIV